MAPPGPNGSYGPVCIVQYNMHFSTGYWCLIRRLHIPCGSADVCGGTFQTFTSNGWFIIFPEVSGVRVIAVSGGGSGIDGHLSGGGGGGYVSCGTLNVTGGASITIVVGTGGTDSPLIVGPGVIAANSGSASSFGLLLSASGALNCTFGDATSPGCPGGPGAGTACVVNCISGSHAGAGDTGCSDGRREQRCRQQWTGQHRLYLMSSTRNLH